MMPKGRVAFTKAEAALLVPIRSDLPKKNTRTLERVT